MRDLTGTTAEDIKFEDAHFAKWVFVMRADEPTDGEDPQYLSSYEITLDANTYEDLLSEISFEGTALDPKGGVAPVGSWSLGIRNEGGLAAQLTNEFFLENDVIESHLVLYRAGETPDEGDRIPVARALIDSYPSDPNEWKIQLVDGSDRDWTHIPQRLVENTEFPGAPGNELGHSIPTTFGNMNIGPFDGVGAKAYLGQCRCVNNFDQHQYTAGLHNWDDGTPFQWYEQARRRAEIIDYTDSAGIMTITSPKRLIILRPVLPDVLEPNDPADWYLCADGDDSTSVTITSGDTLAVFLSGAGGKLGSLYTDPIVSLAGVTGSYTYSVDLGATNLASGTGSGNKTFTLAKATWAEDWTFEQVLITITATSGDTVISQLTCEVRYNDQSSLDSESGLEVWRKVQGVYDSTSIYRDGSLITGVADTVLTNPVDQVQAILRMKDLLNRPIAEINTTSFATARALRTSWNFAFTMYKQWKDIKELDPLLKEAGLHLFRDAEDKWTIVARAKETAPQHALLDGWNIAVVDAEDDWEEWIPDVKVNRVSNRDLVNDFIVHAQLDGATGNHNVLAIASSAFRINGTCSVDAATGVLYAAGESFTAEALVGMITYVDVDQAYEVLSITDDEHVVVDPVEGATIIDSPSGTEFWMGVNLDPEALRSWRRYKVQNPMGSESTGDDDEGGYRSSFIADVATAELMIDFWQEWYGRIHQLVSTSTFLGHVDIEEGDVLFFDHPELQESKRATDLTLLDGAINDFQVTFKVTDDEVELVREDDYVLLVENPRHPEIVKVTGFDPDTDIVTCLRGQCNTQPWPHGDGTAVKRLTTKWEVLHKIPATPADCRIRLQLLEVPTSYFPVLIIAPDTIDDWATMTTQEQSQFRVITHNSELIEERDPTSLAVIGAD